MRTRRHPLSGAIYDVRPDGLVSVDKDGVTGVFRPDGRYVEGELTHADMHLCLWIAGPQLPKGKSVPTRDMPIDFVTD